MRNYLKGQGLVKSNLFRPPYGRITSQQAKSIKGRSTIVMWDVLSGDFDTSRTADECTEAVLKNATGGSIIVYHDSEKAKDRVLGSLPKVLEELTKQGYTFDVI
ncbi:MAG: hypothetical protein HRT74_08135 [Flavobacteriales bacterium]|nr:hypothetical protein [Flavobacteriales bacterium]